MIKYVLVLLGLAAGLWSCADRMELSSVDPVNWDKRTIQLAPSDSLQEGSSYLSVYSQIFSQTEHRTHDLTATISMRNVNRTDSVYLRRPARP